MPKIYPKTPDASAPESEKKVFAKFRDGLPANWTVIHARRFLLPARGRRQRTEGEVDFLVLDPDRGYLGLEVKGGREIRRDEDGWVSVDYYGNSHRIRDPGHQAQKAVHSIAEYMNSSSGPRDRLDAVSFGWGVVFPDFDVSGNLDAALPREVILDRRDLENPTKCLERVFKAQKVNGPSLSSDTEKAWMSAIAPTVHLAPSLAARIEYEQQQLLRLTEEQTHILDFLADWDRLAVEGSAGTGKTLVAMERARRLAAAGQRVLLLCYNKLLGDHLATLAEGFTVDHFHSFCSKMSVSAGLTFAPPKDGEAAQEFWEEKAPELLMEALDSYPDERFDAVIIDEGQDFRELWWLAVEKLLKDADSSLWVFFDPHQNIFGGGPTEALGLKAANLTWNCRNTTKIGTYCSNLVEAEAKFRPGAPEGMDVRTIDCSSDSEMVDAVRRSLHELVSQGQMSPERITVLTARSALHSPVWRANKLGNLTLVDFPRKPGPNEVSFATLKRFKGLESDAVIVCDVDESEPYCSPRHLYVGTSRARHILVVARRSRKESQP